MDKKIKKLFTSRCLEDFLLAVELYFPDKKITKEQYEKVYNLETINTHPYIPGLEWYIYLDLMFGKPGFVYYDNYKNTQVIILEWNQ